MKSIRARLPALHVLTSRTGRGQAPQLDADVQASEADTDYKPLGADASPKPATGLPALPPELIELVDLALLDGRSPVDALDDRIALRLTHPALAAALSVPGERQRDFMARRGYRRAVEHIWREQARPVLEEHAYNLWPLMPILQGEQRTELLRHTLREGVQAPSNRIGCLLDALPYLDPPQRTEVLEHVLPSGLPLSDEVIFDVLRHLAWLSDKQLARVLPAAMQKFTREFYVNVQHVADRLTQQQVSDVFARAMRDCRWGAVLTGALAHRLTTQQAREALQLAIEKPLHGDIHTLSWSYVLPLCTAAQRKDLLAAALPAHLFVGELRVHYGYIQTATAFVQHVELLRPADRDDLMPPIELMMARARGPDRLELALAIREKLSLFCTAQRHRLQRAISSPQDRDFQVAIIRHITARTEHQASIDALDSQEIHTRAMRLVPVLDAIDRAVRDGVCGHDLDPEEELELQLLYTQRGAGTPRYSDGGQSMNQIRWAAWDYRTLAGILDHHVLCRLTLESGQMADLHHVAARLDDEGAAARASAWVEQLARSFAGDLRSGVFDHPRSRVIARWLEDCSHKLATQQLLDIIDSMDAGVSQSRQTWRYAIRDLKVFRGVRSAADIDLLVARVLQVRIPWVRTELLSALSFVAQKLTSSRRAEVVHALLKGPAREPDQAIDDSPRILRAQENWLAQYRWLTSEETMRLALATSEYHFCTSVGLRGLDALLRVDDDKAP